MKKTATALAALALAGCGEKPTALDAQGQETLKGIVTTNTSRLEALTHSPRSCPYLSDQSPEIVDRMRGELQICRDKIYSNVSSSLTANAATVRNLATAVSGGCSTSLTALAEAFGGLKDSLAKMIANDKAWRANPSQPFFNATILQGLEDSKSKVTGALTAARADCAA